MVRRRRLRGRAGAWRDRRGDWGLGFGDLGMENRMGWGFDFVIQTFCHRSRRGEVVGGAIRYLVLWFGLEEAVDGVLVGEGI